MGPFGGRTPDARRTVGGKAPRFLGDKARKLLTYGAGRLVVWLPPGWGFHDRRFLISTWCSATFKPNTEIFAFPITLWPRKRDNFNYAQLFSEFPFARWFGNCVFVASARTLLSVFLSALAGFGFAKYRFPRANVLLVSSSPR